MQLYSASIFNYDVKLFNFYVMNRQETIIISSVAGVALLAVGYIHRELLVKNLRKFKAWCVHEGNRLSGHTENA